MMLRWLLIVSFVLVALPVAAQSAYVAGSVSGDISRASHQEVRGRSNPNGDAEVVSWELRAGTFLSPRFGVDLTFARAEEFETDFSNVGPLLLSGLSDFEPRTLSVPGTGSVVVTGQGTTSVPIFLQELHVTRRDTSLDTTVWGRQRANDRVDLIYSGGIAFFRTVQKIEYRFRPGQPQPLAIFVQPTRTISYGIGPVVGMEARISMTDHLRLLPGLKLYGRTGDGPHGWLIRPAVGLGWFF
jgi:hypothetical protein